VSGNGPVLDGKFDVPGLAPGRYSVTVGGNDVPQKTVQADAGTEGLAIRYGQGGAIEGRLLRPDGTGAPGAWVSAQGSEGSTAAQTGPDGRFSIRELPAGTYTVMAGMQADGKSLHASTANVSVAVGGTTSGLELTLAE
jgi:hypothetical protein